MHKKKTTTIASNQSIALNYFSSPENVVDTVRDSQKNKHFMLRHA